MSVNQTMGEIMPVHSFSLDELHLLRDSQHLDYWGQIVREIDNMTRVWEEQPDAVIGTPEAADLSYKTGDALRLKDNVFILGEVAPEELAIRGLRYPLKLDVTQTFDKQVLVESSRVFSRSIPYDVGTLLVAHSNLPHVPAPTRIRRV